MWCKGLLVSWNCWTLPVVIHVHNTGADLRLVRGAGALVEGGRTQVKIEAGSHGPAEGHGAKEDTGESWVVGACHIVKAPTTRPDGIWKWNPSPKVPHMWIEGFLILGVRRGLEGTSQSAGGWEQELSATQGWRGYPELSMGIEGDRSKEFWRKTQDQCWLDMEQPGASVTSDWLKGFECDKWPAEGPRELGT